MTLDQTIQVWMAVGTWLAGVATLAAVIVALHLARRAERIRLKVHVGHRVVIIGDGSPFQEHLSISVTNLGERAVTINSVGWAVGKGSQRKYCIQPVSGPFTTQFPVELAHGKNANFMVSFLATPNWLREFSTGFIKDLSDRSINTLVVQIHTSVGETIEVRPEGDLIRKLKESATVATG